MEYAFASIPADATSLDLSHNNLYKIITTAIVAAFRNLPSTIEHINLDYNELSYKLDNGELVEILRAIRPGTTVSLKQNGLFQHNVSEYKYSHAIFESKPLQQCDELINMLHECNPTLTLDLSNNGEEEELRAKLV